MLGVVGGGSAADQFGGGKSRLDQVAIKKFTGGGFQLENKLNVVLAVPLGANGSDGGVKIEGFPNHKNSADDMGDFQVETSLMQSWNSQAILISG